MTNKKNDQPQRIGASRSAVRATVPAFAQGLCAGLAPGYPRTHAEISLADTPTDFGGESNAPVLVYDTSGPYTDPSVIIDVRKGLADVRSAWIDARGDTERLAGLSSDFGQQRLNDAELACCVLPTQPAPGRGANVSQCTMPARASLPPRWNTWPSART